MSKEYERYFSNIEDNLRKLYEVAAQARSRGLDPVLTPEPEVTRDIAERVEKLIGPPGVRQQTKLYELLSP
jgi:DNA polymerase II large subunit